MALEFLSFQRISDEPLRRLFGLNPNELAHRTFKALQSSISHTAIDTFVPYSGTDILVGGRTKRDRYYNTDDSDDDTPSPFHPPNIRAISALDSYRNEVAQKVFIDVYTLPLPNDRSLPGVETRRHTSGDTQSEEALAFAEQMVGECLENHPRCPRNEDVILPTRLLDISDCSVRLRETGGQRGRYAALSHCWGGSVRAQTTSETYKSFTTDIPWTDLPRTFQDAILFSRSLGLSYIWIDSLCIIQDSKTDWNSEASRMKQVYQGAFVTLAATSSENGEGGCFKKAEFRPYKIASNTLGNTSIDLFVRRQWRHLIPLEVPWEKLDAPWLPLLDRAWVFQERILSTRVVHFTTNELMWECAEKTACECLALQQPAFIPWLDKTMKTKFHAAINNAQARGAEIRPEGQSSIAPTPHPQPEPHIWISIANEYSRLNLARESDRLPAISGVARSLEILGLGTYHAGLWEAELPSNLAWFACQPSQSRRFSSNPSWSWTSVGGSVRLSTDNIELTVHSIECDLEADDAYSAVQGGRLIVTGKLFEVRACSYKKLGSRWRAEVERHGYHEKAVEFDGRSYFCLWDEPPTRSLTKEESLYCLNLGPGAPWSSDANILVLQCLDPPSRTFKRIGLIKGRHQVQYQHPRDGPLMLPIKLQTWTLKAAVKQLLDAGNVDIEARDSVYGCTPLLWAVCNGHEAVVKLLLDTGEVDVEARDSKDGQTPLFWTVMNEHPTIIKLLIDTNKIDVNMKDSIHGQTPLFWAAILEHETIVKLLLDTSKADVDVKDEDGRMALSQAAENGHEMVIKLLLHAGKAKAELKDSNS